jgi:hypothetical protein
VERDPATVFLIVEATFSHGIDGFLSRIWYSSLALAAWAFRASRRIVTSSRSVSVMVKYRDQNLTLSQYYLQDCRVLILLYQREEEANGRLILSTRHEIPNTNFVIILIIFIILVRRNKTTSLFNVK